VRGDRKRLDAFISDAVRWTFWPSVGLALVLLLLGKPILMLFGPGFEDGYELMCVMMVGLIVRASVGPSERLLTMTGEQPFCAVAYAAAFVANLALCLILIPQFGLHGAAFASAAAIVLESVLLFAVAKWRLGLHVFIWRGSRER
jgi:O-antigen/teichoic acid export membrane protein